MSNYRKFIILTVEPLNNTNKNFRFGLMNEDYNQIKKQILNLKSVDVVLNSNEIEGVVNVNDSLKTYCKYGKLVNPLISKWIIENDFHLYTENSPTKFIFELKITKEKHFFKLYKNKSL